MNRIILVLLISIDFGLANEHWFIFNQNQFQGFNIPLFTLIFNNSIKENNSQILNFTLSTYEHSINIKIDQNNITQELIKLNLQRADIITNKFNHLIFLVIRNENQFETYVNCKKIDSYLYYSLNQINSSKIINLSQTIQHIYSNDEYIFKQYNCKQTLKLINNITKPFIGKMQNLINKIQQRSKSFKYHQSLTDSLTIIFKPNLIEFNDNQTNFYTIINISQIEFSIRYYPKEHFLDIQFDHKNRTEFYLYTDKSTDINQSLISTIYFLHITPIMIHCYVNCELTDDEYFIDKFYIKNLIRNIKQYEKQYDQKSTLIIFNTSIDEISMKFYCLKLNKINENFLPYKYTFRKFLNALDILENNLDEISQDSITTPILNVSEVNIHAINGFGSLLSNSFHMDTQTVSNEIIEYNRNCLNDYDCNTNLSFLKCQYQHCICTNRYFWSIKHHRCILCKDLLIGHRCFRFSNHKSTWYKANDYCQNDEEQEYTMKLTSNINRTDIQLLKQILIDENNHDYFYWIGAINHQHRQTIIFHWYDNGDLTQLNMSDLWCSQKEYSSNINHKNQLCISLTTCGLYADDCQRNSRFLCEAI